MDGCLDASSEGFADRDEVIEGRNRRLRRSSRGRLRHPEPRRRPRPSWRPDPSCNKVEPGPPYRRRPMVDCPLDRGPWTSPRWACEPDGRHRNAPEQARLRRDRRENAPGRRSGVTKPVGSRGGRSIGMTKRAHHLWREEHGGLTTKLEARPYAPERTTIGFGRPCQTSRSRRRPDGRCLRMGLTPVCQCRCSDHLRLAFRVPDPFECPALGQRRTAQWKA
ncbi:MAG: hypothetical protein HLUCCA08_00060 [Rhodobacteraceae bacterium HLUCCA08]|nr:MAG: hypothetical protein HLUCCA08_00060 [Rhodobacteraceae bacterium HLUCCA08]